MSSQPGLSEGPEFVFSQPTRKREGIGTTKKLLVAGFLGITASLVGYLTYNWFVFSATHISTNDSFVQADMWPINSHNLGYIKSVEVKENQAVKKGDLLVVLEDKDLQIELRYKQARYEKALADVKRARALSQSRMVSASDLETAEATLVSLEADRDGTLLKMEFTKILSPIDGVISKSGIHVGQFIQPGQTLLMVVAKSPIWVQANFKETQLAKVHAGLPVEVEIDAYPDVVWRGVVEGIYPASGASMSLFPPENSTGNFTKIVQRIPVSIRLENKPGYHLRSGMSANATIVLK